MREGCREGIYRADSCALCVGGRRVVCAGSAALFSVGKWGAGGDREHRRCCAMGEGCADSTRGRLGVLQ